MTDRERIVAMADGCRQAGHTDVSFRNPCVPCIGRLIEEIRGEYTEAPVTVATRIVHASA